MTDNKNNTRPLCTECIERGLKVPMHKAGSGISGRKRYQSYRCPRCLRTHLNTREEYIRIKDRE